MIDGLEWVEREKNVEVIHMSLLVVRYFQSSAIDLNWVECHCQQHCRHIIMVWNFATSSITIHTSRKCVHFIWPISTPFPSHQHNLSKKNASSNLFLFSISITPLYPSIWWTDWLAHGKLLMFMQKYPEIIQNFNRIIFVNKSTSHIEMNHKRESKRWNRARNTENVQVTLSANALRNKCWFGWKLGSSIFVLPEI